MRYTVLCMTIGSLLCLNVGCGKSAPAKFEEFAKRLDADLSGTRLSKPSVLVGSVYSKVEKSTSADSSHVATLTFLPGNPGDDPQGPLFIGHSDGRQSTPIRGTNGCARRSVKTVEDVRDASGTILERHEKRLRKEYVGKEVIQLLTGGEVAQNRTDEIVCLLSDCVAP